MKSLITDLLSLALVLVVLQPSVTVAGQRRRAVVRKPVAVRHPVVRTKLVVHRGHPIRRALPGTVVVRPARHTVVVGAPLLFLPGVNWTATTMSLPSRDRVVWQDSEQIFRDEHWVETNFGVDADGNALFLNIDGQVKLNFAEVAFANGNVQVVDFNEQIQNSGMYKLLDFAGGRRVKTMRLLARSETDEAKLAVYLSR